MAHLNLMDFGQSFATNGTLDGSFLDLFLVHLQSLFTSKSLFILQFIIVTLPLSPWMSSFIALTEITNLTFYLFKNFCWALMPSFRGKMGMTCQKGSGHGLDLDLWLLLLGPSPLGTCSTEPRESRRHCYHLKISNLPSIQGRFVILDSFILLHK